MLICTILVLLLHHCYCCHPYPKQMTSLRELDLSGNLLTELPNSLATLPKLEVRCEHTASALFQWAFCWHAASAVACKASWMSSDCKPAGKQLLGELGVTPLIAVHLGQTHSKQSCDCGAPLLHPWGPAQVLRLENNRLECLPDNMGELHGLIKLDISTNCLRQLPASMGCLKRIQRIDVANNLLTRVPPAMGHLKSIKELNLKYNSLDDRYKGKAEEGLSRYAAVCLGPTQLTLPSTAAVLCTYT